MTKRKAPAVVNSRYLNVSADFIKLEWDTVGLGFLYEIIRGRIMANGNVIWDAEVIYITDFDTFTYFDSNVKPLTTYIYKIRARGRKFEPSDWHIMDSASTTKHNENSISTQYNFTLSPQVIDRNLLNENLPNKFIFSADDGGDISLTAYLMQRGFIYDAYNVNDISQVSDQIVTIDKYVVNYDSIPKVCTWDLNRTIAFQDGDLLYAVERWQPHAKVSNDFGETWYPYQAFPGRLANTVANDIITQSLTKTYALGFEHVYENKGTDALSFSSIDVKWSDVEQTFDWVTDETYGLPFKAAEYNNFAPLSPYPKLSYEDDVDFQHPNLKHGAEAFAVNDSVEDTIIVAISKGEIGIFDQKNSEIINADLTQEQYDALSPQDKAIYDERLELDGQFMFNNESIHLIEDSSAWAELGFTSDDIYPGTPCTRNCVYYNDPNAKNETDFSSISNGAFYFLYLGDWVTDTTYASPRFTQDIGITQLDENGDLNPLIGVYRLNYYLDFEGVSEDGKPINPKYKWDDVNNLHKLTRIYGNTEYERERLDLYSAMSIDENHLIVKVLNDTVDSEVETRYFNVIENPYSGTDDDDPQIVMDSDGTNRANDQLLIDNNENVAAAVKFFKRPYYTTTAKTNQQILAFDSRIIQGNQFAQNKPMDYYDAANCIYFRKDGRRMYKSHKNDFIVLYNEELKTQPLLVNENRIDEVYKVTANDITFRNFEAAADGILICETDKYSNDVKGGVIGYYSFGSSLNKYAPLKWHPDNTMFTAELLHVETETESPTLVDSELVDANLLSVFDTMGAPTYFEDNLFGDFNRYYVEFLSKGSATSYNNMLNLMKMHDPQSNHYNEQIHEATFLSNSLPHGKKKDDIIKFFLSRDNDFYSAKGVLDSYKFLFKLLYNEDVEIEIESESKFSFTITVKSDYIDESIINKNIRTVTGYATVTSFRQYFENGISNYKIYVEGISGKFISGQTVKVDNYNTNNQFAPITINIGLKSEFVVENEYEALSKGQSYYTMKIKTQLQHRQYADDIQRFVHPIGFPYIGITLITILIDGGLSLKSDNTMIEQSLTLTYDSGIPTMVPDYTSALDENSEREYWSDGTLKVQPHTNSLIPVEDQNAFYLEQAGFGISSGTFVLSEAIAEYDAENEDSDWFGFSPNDRRRPYAPTYDDAVHSFSNLYRGPLDRFGKIKFPNSILYKYYNDNVTIEDDSNIKQHQVHEH